MAQLCQLNRHKVAISFVALVIHPPKIDPLTFTKALDHFSGHFTLFHFGCHWSQIDSFKLTAHTNHNESSGKRNMISNRSVCVRARVFFLLFQNKINTALVCTLASEALWSVGRSVYWLDARSSRHLNRDFPNNDNVFLCMCVCVLCLCRIAITIIEIAYYDSIRQSHTGAILSFPPNESPTELCQRNNIAPNKCENEIYYRKIMTGSNKFPTSLFLFDTYFYFSYFSFSLSFSLSMFIA